MQTWLITGCNRGIGLAMSRLVLREGHRVIGLCRNPGGERDLWELEGDYGDALRVETADVDSQVSLDQAGAALQGETIDILVNNAGILEDYGSGLRELSLNLVERSFRINAMGAMRVTRTILPMMNDGGVIASLSSRVGSIADNSSGGGYAYRMSKAALNMFNKNLSLEYPQFCCVVLHPGWVKTTMGGPGATSDVMDAAAGMIRVIDGLQPRHSGGFYSYDFNEIPW